MNKVTHALVQGTPEWAEYRKTMFGASEAAAMLGLSPHVSRTELLHMKYTCSSKEYSDWFQLNVLDHGHEVEALARPIMEVQLGESLYPVVCSVGRLSASCDGLTMMEDCAWEHKQWNEELVDSVLADVLPDAQQPQCQQIMMVTGAEFVYFTVSDGTPDNMVTMKVLPSQEWQDRIRAGWEQFEADLAVYEPKTYAPKPAADVILALPALSIQIKGEVTLSNLPLFKAKAEHFIAQIKTDLKTDEDFSNAEATIKFCDETEKALDQAKRSALAQTTSIDELMRTVDYIRDQLRDKRLALDKLVKSQKEAIKETILLKAQAAFAEHVAALEKEIAPLRLVFQSRDFAGAMRGKRTLATLNNAVDTELANGKVTVNQLAQAVRGRLTWYRAQAAGFEFLFADLQQLIQKPDDDFQLAVTSRIEKHQAPAVPAPAPAEAPATTDTSASESSMAERPLDVLAPPVSWPFPSGTLRPRRADTPPDLRLGQIAERLGFPLTADFLRTLGFEPSGRDRAAVLFHEHEFELICEALIKHVTLARQHAVAA